MFPSSLIVQPEQQSQHFVHSRKQKNTKSFTGKVRLRRDVTKTSGRCMSKSDGECSTHALEFSHSSNIFFHHQVADWPAWERQPCFVWVGGFGL